MSRKLYEEIRDKLDTSDIDQELWIEYNEEICKILDDNEFYNKCNIELSRRMNNAIHRIQLLQMDGEVSVKDLGFLLRDLKGADKKETELLGLIDRQALARFGDYLDKLYSDFYSTPADNLEQEAQRASCMVLLEEIIKKYAEIFDD